MSASLVPRIEAYPGPDDRDGWLVSVPFDLGFVSELKAHVPPAYREWREETRTWWVSESHHPIVVHLLKRHWLEYGVVQDDGTVEIITRSGEHIRQGGLW